MQDLSVYCHRCGEFPDGVEFSVTTEMVVITCEQCDTSQKFEGK